jgi:hypothetical protein
MEGRYPDFHEDYLLDGQPASGHAYRTNFGRRVPLVAAGLTATADTGYVVPIVVQQGDLISKVTIGVKTATSSTPTAGFAALFTGLTTAATLITGAASANDTSGFHGSGAAQTFTLATPYQVGGAEGTTGTNGPLVLGVMLYNNGGAGGVIDAYSVGSEAVAGGVYLTGQIPLLFTKASLGSLTAPPSTLSGFAAAAAGFVCPLVILS